MRAYDDEVGAAGLGQVDDLLCLDTVDEMDMDAVARDTGRGQEALDARPRFLLDELRRPGQRRRVEPRLGQRRGGGARRGREGPYRNR